MKTLLLMRHAKTSPAQPGQSDIDRSLNPQGRNDAPRVGQWLLQQGLVPDLIISSSARRAVETAGGVADASGYRGDPQATHSLYEAGTAAYLDVLRAVPDAHAAVLVVAHNPAIEDMVEALTGQALTMPTGALACLSLPIDQWQSLNLDVPGRLVQVAQPRQFE